VYDETTKYLAAPPERHRNQCAEPLKAPVQTFPDRGRKRLSTIRVVNIRDHHGLILGHGDPNRRITLSRNESIRDVARIEMLGGNHTKVLSAGVQLVERRSRTTQRSAGLPDDSVEDSL